MTHPAPTVTAEELALLDAACFPVPERWAPAAWDDELRGGDRLLGFRRDGRTLVAAATVRVVADVADLHRIMVDPGHRGRGIARGLLDEMLGRAGVDASRMLLEVRHDNLAALALYRGVGFGTIATRPDYYGPGAHALVLERALAAPGEGPAGAVPSTAPVADRPGRYDSLGPQPGGGIA